MDGRDQQGSSLDDDDLGLQAHRAAELHLEACWAALDAEGEGEHVDWPDMAGPFCGCQTCGVREVLHAAWPYLQRAAQLELEHLGSR